MFWKNGNDQMTRLISKQISCLFCNNLQESLPTYNANGEIEVRQNTLLRLVYAS